MYARLTQLEIDTVRVPVGDALALFERDVLPSLRGQAGYRGVYVLATPEGKGALLSLWDTAEQADAGAAGGLYAETLGRYLTMFKAPPGRERYQVLLVDAPVAAEETVE